MQHSTGYCTHKQAYANNSKFSSRELLTLSSGCLPFHAILLQTMTSPEIQPRVLERCCCCSDIFTHPVLVGITRYPTVCLICARKRSRVSAITLKTRKVKRQPHVLVISADPKKKKPACRASYNASPEKKRAASRASYRADPEKRAASGVASRASGLLTACSSI